MKIDDNNFGDSENADGANQEPPELLHAAQRIHRLFGDFGASAKLSPSVLLAALQLERHSAADHDLLLEDTRLFFRRRAIITPEGLETLPAPWLKSIPRALLTTLKPGWSHIPYMITSLRFSHSVLCVLYAQEGEFKQENRVTRWDQLRMTLNTAVLPNIWTALTPGQRIAIWDSRPDLRDQLLGFIPGVALVRN